MVASNQDKRFEVFMVGNTRELYHRWQVAPNGGWSSNPEWESLGGDWPRDPIIGSNQDGRLEVFMVGNTRELYHCWQFPGGGWSQWESLGGDWPRDPIIGSNQDGRLEVFMVGNTRELYHRWQVAPNGGWSSNPKWESLGGDWPLLPPVPPMFRGPMRGAPLVRSNQDGRLQVFARGIDRHLYHDWQMAPDLRWH